MLVRLGQLVTSRAGRDQGKHFLVIAKKDEKWIWIANGSSHKVEKPKKKNISHLIIHSQLAQSIAEKLTRNESVTNRELRKALLQWDMTE